MQNIKENIKIIISINIHENINFLIKQLINIDNFVKENYKIILNCNIFMYYNLNKLKILQIKKFKNKVFINPFIIEKKRYHGSLTFGIYKNLEYALKKFNFEYFIVLSSRNLFYNKLNISQIKYHFENFKIYGQKKELINHNECHWNSFKKTLLYKYFEFGNLVNTPHEGLCFDYNNCKIIYNFLENNKNIKDNLFNFNDCVEEFGLQTISINLYNGFINIGNGTNTQFDINLLPQHLFLYKTLRK